MLGPEASHTYFWSEKDGRECEDLKGNEDSTSFYRTLDYEQEKYITLDEYLDSSFDSKKPELERILDIEIDYCPDFILFSDDISLLYNEKEGTGYIGSLNQKDLYHLKNK